MFQKENVQKNLKKKKKRKLHFKNESQPKKNNA